MAPGWKIGNYVVEDPAGFARGTFGTLYVARRTEDDAKVAMKLVLLTNAADGRDRLEAERHGAMLQQRFEQAHGMVPRVYEYGPYNEHLYIAMEFVEGKSLSELIKAGMSPQQAASYASGICDFLDKAHRFETTIEGVRYDRIVHADLKPDHLLIAGSGAMKVLDFGIAKALEKTTEVTTNNWSTVAYASPERLQSGGHVNVHADFWSLGVMLYEMIAGHLPYPSLIPRHMRSQLEEAIRTNRRPEPLPSSCPPDLAAIVGKLMAHQAEHRYPTASAIRADLELFLAGRVPSAVVQYATAATVPVMRTPRTDVSVALPPPVPPTEPFPVQATRRRGRIVAAFAQLVTTPRLSTPAVSTERPPVPATPPAAVAAGAPAPSQPSGRWLGRFGGGAAPRPRRRGITRRAASFAVQLAAVVIVAAEGGAWVSAERFRGGIQAIEGPTLGEKRRAYEAIRGWAPLDMGLRARVDLPLQRRLVALADAVIADYRQEGPTMSAAQWEQAHEAVLWARELSPRDQRLQARQAICEAHLARLRARVHRRGTTASREAYREAVARFEAAAKLDEGSFDPYLGISNIEAYALGDVEMAAEAIAEAEKRGYEPGRRERAQLGDGYLRRGDRSRRRAAALAGEARRTELEKARDDYARCVERFTPIQDFGRSGENLAYCQEHLERIGLELAAPPPASTMPSWLTWIM